MITKMKETFICGYVLSMNDTSIHIRCELTIFNDEYRENVYEYSTILQRRVAIKEILLFKLGVSWRGFLKETQA